MIELEPYFTSFDIDEQTKFIRTYTKENKFKSYNLGSTKDFKPDDEDLRNASCKINTYKFSYTMQGIFQGLTYLKYISSFCKAHNKNLLIAGDDDYLLNLCNYPCIIENPKLKQYRGHS